MSARGPFTPHEFKPEELDPATVELVTEDIDPSALPAEPDIVALEAPAPSRTRFGDWFWGGFGVLLGGGLIYETWRWIADLFTGNPILGSAFALALLAAVIGASGVVWREIRALMSLHNIENLRQLSARIKDEDTHGQAGTVIPPLEKIYRDREDVAEALARFEARDDEALSDSERMTLFARTVLEPLDKRAYRLVMAGARDISVLTAISPLGLLDGLIVFGRNLMTMRQVAGLYGVRPGFFATLGLIKRSLRNLAIAGMAELVTDTATSQLGASLMGLLSAKAGQGMTNGILAARFGLATIVQCRPLAFEEGEMPKLAHIRKELFGADADKLPGTATGGR